MTALNSNAQSSLDFVTAYSATVVGLPFLQGLEDGQKVNLLGYYEEDDGHGQRLIYRSMGRDSITVDRGFFFAGPGDDDYFEAVDKSVADISRFGAKAGDVNWDNAPSVNRAIAAQLDNRYETGSVYVPPGEYFLATRVVIDCKHKPRLRWTGAGPSQSVFRATDDLPSPMISTINDNDRDQFLRDSYIGAFSVIGTSPNGNQPNECVVLSMQHTNIDELSVTGGNVAGLTLRYCVTSSFRNCRFVGSNRFGMRTTHPVTNQVAFDRCTFLSNMVAGFYCARGGNNLSFTNACGFERNGVFGAFFAYVRGLVLHGNYFEGNGHANHHTFRTRSGVFLLGDDWRVRGDVCLSGITTHDGSLDRLKTDTQPIGCDAVSMMGNSGSPTDKDHRHVVLAGVSSAAINQPSGYDEQPWLASQNGLQLWNNLELTGKVRRIPHIEYAATSMATHGRSQGRDNSRFSWVPRSGIHLALAVGEPGGNATWTPRRLSTGRLVYELGSDDRGTTDYVRLLQFVPDIVEEVYIASVYAYFMSDVNNGRYRFGAQIKVGDKETDASVASVNPGDIVTAANTQPGSNAITVSSAEGIRVGSPILVGGLTTTVEAIRGRTVELDAKTEHGGMAVTVRVPALSRIDLQFTPQWDSAVRVPLHIRRTAGEGRDKAWVDRIVIRPLGSSIASA